MPTTSAIPGLSRKERRRLCALSRSIEKRYGAAVAETAVVEKRLFSDGRVALGLSLDPSSLARPVRREFDAACSAEQKRRGLPDDRK